MEHIHPHQHKIGPQDRIRKQGHGALVIWFTGLSGSGKSTLASALEAKLFEKGIRTYILDGDNIRAGLNKGLSFSDEDRKENIRRISEVAKLFVDAGVVVLSAFISPFASERDLVKQTVGIENYVEVFVDTPLEVCEQRDVKGLYEKARKGEIKNFTGIDSPFEVPQSPDLSIQTHKLSLEEAVEVLYNNIITRIKKA